MDIRDRGMLRFATTDVLESAVYSPRRLALLHSAVSLGVSLLLTALQFLIARGIDATSGLAGLGTRSVLETLESVLQFAVGILLPFWEIGFIYCAIRIARKQTAEPRDLTRGFFRLGAVLRLMLLETVLYVGLAILCLNVSTVIFTMTPLSAKMEELIMPMITGAEIDMEAMLTQISNEEMLAATRPMLVLFGILFGAALLPVSYSLRQTKYLIMDDPAIGAFAAVRTSFRYMRRNRWALARVDLQFWWYYLAIILLAGVGYADLLLPLVGVTLPISANVAFFLFYGIQLLGQLLLCWRKKAQVDTTYALIYDNLKEISQ